LFAHFYRRRFDLFVACGILFNHESPRRPLQYVSQKIAHAAAAVSLGIMTTVELDQVGRPSSTTTKLRLGNLDVHRDFGFAGDYAEVMRLALQAGLASAPDSPKSRMARLGQRALLAHHVRSRKKRHASAEQRGRF
jgi:GDP-D-mannose dehydratase